MVHKRRCLLLLHLSLLCISFPSTSTLAFPVVLPCRALSSTGTPCTVLDLGCFSCGYDSQFQVESSSASHWYGVVSCLVPRDQCVLHKGQFTFTFLFSLPQGHLHGNDCDKSVFASVIGSMNRSSLEWCEIKVFRIQSSCSLFKVGCPFECRCQRLLALARSRLNHLLFASVIANIHVDDDQEINYKNPAKAAHPHWRMELQNQRNSIKFNPVVNKQKPEP